jgi:acyl carrier protein
MDDRLIKILAAILELDEERINEEISSENVDSWDSFKQMNIIIAVEEEFGIQFDEEESILSDSYASLLKIIHEKK